MSEHNGSPRSVSWSSFLFGFGFLVGLVNRYTVTGSESVPHRSPRSLIPSSLDTVEGVMVVEEDKLEEQLVDKPGTRIGTKFSVLHCIRIPFLMRCGFWPLIHSYEYPCSSQSFPSDRTAGVSSRSFIVKKNPTLRRKLWPLQASALHHWLL